MTYKTKYYLRGLLITGIVFAIFFNMDIYRGPTSFLSVIIPVLFFGGFMVFSAISLRDYTSALTPQEKSLDNYSLSPSFLIKSALSIDQVKTKLTFNEFIVLKDLSIEANQLKASVKFSMRSFGENITFDLVKNENKSNFYRVKSKSKNPFTLFDYGKNFENVILINRAIDGQILNLDNG